jgi:RND family efflux transporter MFP subunit
MKKIFIPFSIIVFSLMISCSENPKKDTQLEPAINVQLNGSFTDKNESYFTSSGKIEAANSANLSTRMMGFVTKIFVTVGQKVNEGDLVLSINSNDLSAKKAQVDAGILQATAAFNSAKKDYDRFVNLFQTQSASQKELDDMTARYEMAKAGLESAKQMRNEVQAQFSYANIRAPFSGIVTNSFVKEGDMASPGMPLIAIEGMKKLQVSTMVSEQNISAIKNGMLVNVLVKSLNKMLLGKVTEVSLSAKNTGGQYLVKVNLTESDPTILSGMFVNVQFPIQNTALNPQKNDKVLVLESALVRQGQLTGVYTIGEGDVAILRWLRLGKTFGNQVEVLAGLTANEHYIIAADGKLFNGAKIKVSK